MASYSVLTTEAPGDFVLVRERFRFAAFLCGPIWFASKRAWLGLVSWMSGVGAIVSLGLLLRIAPEALTAAVVAFMFLMALEAPQFHRRSLRRRGFRLEDVVEAGDRNEAEVRYLARHLPQRADDKAAHALTRTQASRSETVGLFLNGT